LKSEKTAEKLPILETDRFFRRDHMERPTAVTVIAILQIIGAVFGILGGVGALFGGAILGTLGGSVESAGTGFMVAIMGIVLLALSVVGLLLAIGLFQLKPWAWMGTLIVQALGLSIGVGSLNSGSGANILGLIFAVVIIAVLLQPNIKRAFGQ
jgi:hypothetical protein